MNDGAVTEFQQRVLNAAEAKGWPLVWWRATVPTRAAGFYDMAIEGEAGWRAFVMGAYAVVCDRLLVALDGVNGAGADAGERF